LHETSVFVHVVAPVHTVPVPVRLMVKPVPVSVFV
jgi:hypothetical protein